MKRSDRRALSADGVPAEHAGVQQIDGQGARDVVGAVPEGEVGRGPVACCQIPSSPRHLVEVPPVDGMERRVSRTDGREPRDRPRDRPGERGTVGGTDSAAARRSGYTRPPTLGHTMSWLYS